MWTPNLNPLRELQVCIRILDQLIGKRADIRSAQGVKLRLQCLVQRLPTMTTKLFVLPGGDIIGRYNDILVYGGARPTKVRRVSSVEWDEKEKSWSARISTFTIYSPTRKQTLRMEGELIDLLLADTIECWNPATDDFECPDCHYPVTPVEVKNCPTCGYGFRNYVDGLRFKDFPFAELLKSP